MRKALCLFLILNLVLACSPQQKDQNKESMGNKTEKENKENTAENDQPRVTGIGGIFFKSSDPVKTREWYYKNLGLAENDYGSMFEFREGRNPDKVAYLQWSPFDEKTTYFEPSDKDFMINYRVVHIEKLLERLKENGVKVLDSIVAYEYGKFVHIMDPDGNKIAFVQDISNSS